MTRPVRAISILLACAPLVALLAPRGAQTVPLYAARNGLACGTCHFDPNGGGPRNEFGFTFAKNRHSQEPEPEGAWKDLNLTNRVGEAMPVYFGVNQRFMTYTNTTNGDSLDRLGFFNMESAIHIAFQPHPRLTLVYTDDWISRSVTDVAARQREAYGMLGGLPVEGYLRAGKFRIPFGLRMDDHTVATRAGFEATAGGRFLPYDPRLPDMGLEVGAERAGFFGRASYSNGRANVVGQNPFAEAKTLKLGYRTPRFETAASLYDDYAKERPATALPANERQTRWGLYGLTHWREFALLGEVAAGTDELRSPGQMPQDKTNLLAWWTELDYAPSRALNVRMRYDYQVLDRSTDPFTRDNNTSTRFALESEWVPVPFAELRFTLRHVDYLLDQGLGVDNENQAYLQFHFSY
jgi:hypothetical protein